MDNVMSRITFGIDRTGASPRDLSPKPHGCLMALLYYQDVRYNSCGLGLMKGLRTRLAGN